MAKLTIIGTSHIASQSVRQIKQAFRRLNPDIVAIELDQARAQRIFRKRTKPRLRDALSIGMTGYTFALLGSALQNRLGDRVGLSVGSDMKTAILESKRHASTLFLIDQPIQKTLRNITLKMSRWEKTKMIFYLLGFLFLPIVSLFKVKTKTIDLSKVPEKEIIKDSLDKIKKHFPGFYEALIEDRNKYMIRQLRYLLARYPDKHILTIVGAGHEDAIRNAFVGRASAG